MKKIFLAGFFQETNSFSPLLTDVALFQRGKFLEGPAVLEEVRGANLELAGMVDEAARCFPSAEIIPGLYCWGVASGPLTDEAFGQLSQQLLATLRRAGPIDAVLISLHGSMSSLSLDDSEGELLQGIRSVVGLTVPVAASFDFHAVMTEKILRQADIAVGYRTYPHVDMAETGRRTVAALARWLAHGRTAKPVARRWDAIVPVDNAQTDSGPMAALVPAIAELETVPGVLTASVFCSHPWIDCPGTGVTLIAYVEPEVAASINRDLERLLRALWTRRQEFLPTCPSVDEFFRQRTRWLGPIAAIDAGDVTTAGAPGDSTEMLRAALNSEEARVLLPLVDASSVEHAHAVGEGRVSEFTLGGSDDATAYNRRVRVEAEIVRLVSGPVRFQGAAFGGMLLDIGPRALLRLGSLQVLVLRHGSWFHDPELWRSVGVEPKAVDVVVQKSHKLFRPAYADIVRTVLTIDTAGCTDRQLARLPFRRVTRPIFPLDEVESFVGVSLL